LKIFFIVRYRGYEDPRRAIFHSVFNFFLFLVRCRGYEDPLLIERLRMMQALPHLPFSSGLVPPHHPQLSSAGARYPELLHQYPYLSPGSAQALDARVTAAERSVVQLKVSVKKKTY
jgi:hypothetical protein